MIWGLTVGNHFAPSQTSFFCSPVYSHQLRGWHFWDLLLLFIWSLQYFCINYSRRYYFSFLLILGMSLWKHSICMFVYEIPASLKCIWNVLRIFLRTREDFFSSHQNLIAFDLSPFLTKWKHNQHGSFLIPDTLTADSSEWLVCTTTNPGLQAKCSVGIGLEKRWTRLGTFWKVAAFLLFLKIVIKMWFPTLYSWLGSQVFLG